MSAGHQPERMCVICRRRFAKSQLLRHVLVPTAPNGSADGLVDGTRADAGKSGLEADEAQARPGRGWYLCSDPECREKFLKLGRVRRKRKGV